MKPVASPETVTQNGSRIVAAIIGQDMHRKLCALPNRRELPGQGRDAANDTRAFIQCWNGDGDTPWHGRFRSGRQKRLAFMRDQEVVHVAGMFFLVRQKSLTIMTRVVGSLSPKYRISSRVMLDNQTLGDKIVFHHLHQVCRPRHIRLRTATRGLPDRNSARRPTDRYAPPPPSM